MRLYVRRQQQWAKACRGAIKQFAKLERRLKLTPAQIAAIQAQGWLP